MGMVRHRANSLTHTTDRAHSGLFPAHSQQDGIIDDRIDAGHLMFMIIGLAAWWFSVPQLATMLSGAEADAPGEQGRRRAFVVEAAQRLAGARPDASGSSLPITKPSSLSSENSPVRQ